MFAGVFKADIVFDLHTGRNVCVQKVSDKLSEGEIVKVKVLEVDKQGRIRLSMKAVAAGQ